MSEVNFKYENYPNIEKSNFYLDKAKKLIPSVTQTLAKGPTQYVDGVAPKYLSKGKGAYVWDVDGNRYLDFNMGIGPISLGYCYSAVDNAIKEQLDSGITFSLMHPLEVEVAEIVQSIIPNAERVRFSKTGCDVTSAAIRLARNYTKRDKILSCGYHGWHDWTIGTTSKREGIPEEYRNLTKKFNYNDFDSFYKLIDEDCAAVIMEPMLFEFPKDNFLSKIRDVCTKNGSLLIFDEMWTGFRLSLGGAQQYFGVNSDLNTFSKAVANGMPISLLTGKAEIMDKLNEDVFFYTTFGGEALSLAAAKVTIKEMQEKKVIDHLHKLGLSLKNNLNKIIEEIGIDYLECIGMGPRSMLSIKNTYCNPLLVKSFIQQELIKNGILWQGSHSICFSHSEKDIDFTLNVYKDVLLSTDNYIKTKQIEKNIFGKPVQPVFRTITGKEK